MTPAEALDTRLRHHLTEAANDVAGCSRMEAELVALGRSQPDARDAVARAYRRIASDDPEGQARPPDPPNDNRETDPAKESRADQQETIPVDDSSQHYVIPPETWQEWATMAGLNGGHAGAGPGPVAVWVPPGGPALPPDERAELANLRAEVERLNRLLGIRQAWRPGMPLPPDSEFLREDLDRDYRGAVYARAREQQVAEDARREREAAGWQEPTILEFPGSLADSLNRERPAQRYLLDGLWGAAHNLSIEAMFKTGKTTLLGSAAGSLADGTPFLGFVPVHPPDGTVAVWNCEMDGDDFDDYLAPHVSDRTRIAVAHLRSRPVPLLTSARDRQMAVAWLRYHGVAVWIIDSWTRLCAWNGVDPVDNGQVGELTACLDEIKGEAGVPALAVTAHMPHAARTDRSFERGFGAQGFSGWVDAMWRYVRDEHGNRYLSAEGRKVRLEECQVFMGGDGRLTAVAGDRDDAAGQTLEYAVLSSIQTHPGRSTARVVKATGRRKADAEAVLRGLEQRGLVTTKPGDRGAVLWYRA